MFQKTPTFKFQLQQRSATTNCEPRGPSTGVGEIERLPKSQDRRQRGGKEVVFWVGLGEDHHAMQYQGWLRITPTRGQKAAKPARWSARLQNPNPPIFTQLQTTMHQHRNHNALQCSNTETIFTLHRVWMQLTQYEITHRTLCNTHETLQHQLSIPKDVKYPLNF